MYISTYAHIYCVCTVPCMYVHNHLRTYVHACIDWISLVQLSQLHTCRIQAYTHTHHTRAHITHTHTSHTRTHITYMHTHITHTHTYHLHAYTYHTHARKHTLPSSTIPQGYSWSGEIRDTVGSVLSACTGQQMPQSLMHSVHQGTL